MKSSFLFLLCVLTTTAFFTSSALTSNKNGVPYSDHCSPIVPESQLTVAINKTIIPDFETQYVVGGDDLLVDAPPNISYMSKHATFQLNPTIYETVDAGVYKVEGTLTLYFFFIRTVGDNHNFGPDSMTGRRTVEFRLHGFLSELSKKICMVGYASQCVFAGDKPVQSNVFLKLSFITYDNPTIHTSFIKGTLESTGSSNDSSYSNPVSIFSFPAVTNYSYSLLPEELGDSWDNITAPNNESLVLDPEMFCPIASHGNTGFVLDFAAECKAGERCSPLCVDNEFLPNYFNLHPIQCSTSGERKIRYLIKFVSTTFSPLSQQSSELNSMFIGEGLWDDKNNRVLVVGCRLLNQADDSRNTVGECSLRLSLRYRSTWTIRNRERVVGRIWTNESVDSPRYFRKIKIMSIDAGDRVDFHDLRYDYTELDRVRGHCIAREFDVKQNQVIFPGRHSCDMMFDIIVKSFSNGKWLASGYARPISIENHVCKRSDDFDAEIYPSITALNGDISSTVVNVGYEIGINFFEIKDFDAEFSALESVSLQGYVVINAEGVYNSESGQLCMVGCRKLVNRALDCDILVNIDFAPADEFTEDVKFSKGIIRSTRKEDDPLRFEEFSLTSSSAIYEDGLAEHYGFAQEESDVSAVSFK